MGYRNEFDIESFYDLWKKTNPIIIVSFIAGGLIHDAIKTQHIDDVKQFLIAGTSMLILSLASTVYLKLRQ